MHCNQCVAQFQTLLTLIESNEALVILNCEIHIKLCCWPNSYLFSCHFRWICAEKRNKRREWSRERGIEGLCQDALVTLITLRLTSWHESRIADDFIPGWLINIIGKELWWRKKEQESTREGRIIALLGLWALLGYISHLKCSQRYMSFRWSSLVFQENRKQVDCRCAVQIKSHIALFTKDNMIKGGSKKAENLLCRGFPHIKRSLSFP